MSEERKIEVLGHYGALLSAVEVGLGSLLHAFHVPLAGIFLSLNQGYLLCRGAIEVKDIPDTRWSVYGISNIAAVLKSLSPAGQKLGPMLSLSMQGLLFNLGVASFGVNAVGLSLGMVLLSFWSFVQPVVTYYLFFGEELFKAMKYAYEKTLPYHHLGLRELTWIFGGLIVLKALLGVGLALLAVKSRGQAFYQEKWVEIAQKQGPLPQGKNALTMALKDLCRPLFLLSLLMTTLFLSYSQHEKGQIGSYLLRPVAVGFIFFYFSRTLTLDRWLSRMENGPWRVFALGCGEALRQLRRLF